jgi:hypothetical protein
VVDVRVVIDVRDQTGLKWLTLTLLVRVPPPLCYPPGVNTHTLWKNVGANKWPSPHGANFPHEGQMSTLRGEIENWPRTWRGQCISVVMNKLGMV